MNGVLRIARLKIALQRAFLGRAILIFTKSTSSFFFENGRSNLEIELFWIFRVWIFSICLSMSFDLAISSVAISLAIVVFPLPHSSSAVLGDLRLIDAVPFFSKKSLFWATSDEECFILFDFFFDPDCSLFLASDFDLKIQLPMLNHKARFGFVLNQLPGGVPCADPLHSTTPVASRNINWFAHFRHVASAA